MTGCSAINCSNRHEGGYRLFSFPKDKTRSKKWLHNMRRDNWFPTASSRLCEKHFEESQYENWRADGFKKLKPNAVPTLFNIPNPPPKINSSPRKSLYKTIQNDQNTANVSTVPNSLQEKVIKKKTHKKLILPLQLADHNYAKMRDFPEEERVQIVEIDNVSKKGNEILVKNRKNDVKDSLEEQGEIKVAATDVNHALEKENKELRAELDKLKNAMKSFLTQDQMTKITEGRIPMWDNESITKGLKFRFALSVHGYDFLQRSGYPLPGYSTLNRRIHSFQLNFGIFQDVIDLLKHKVESLDPHDRYCVISCDEMVINSKQDFDKNTGEFFGFVTLGDGELRLGDKIFLVLVRGIRNPWKQVIACHVTPKTAIDCNLIKNFILSCIRAVESCGLYVVLLSSDLDSRNKALWTSLGIVIDKFGTRVNFFNCDDGHDIYVTPDVCHILKNLKAALLRQLIFLPEAYVEHENLPTNVVSGAYIRNLWDYETSNKEELRSLHHLEQKDIYPTDFEKMNVGAAIRFFSLKTSVALESAVIEKTLPKEALTTAHFIRFINEWFALLTSKVRKTSITTRNCDIKYIFLHKAIEIFQNTIFKEHWKPLNYAGVLATLTFADVAEFLFKNNFSFYLGHRATQDATENVFSQIRRRAGKLPSSLESLRMIRLICVSQYMSEVQRSNYCNDSDEFLIDFCAAKNTKINQNSSFNISDTVNTKKANIITDLGQIRKLPFIELCEKFDFSYAKHVFHIAGSTTNAIFKNSCEKCTLFLNQANLPQNDFIMKISSYTKKLDLGGLKTPCKEILHLIMHCSFFYDMFKDFILRNGVGKIVEQIVKNVDINLSECDKGCNLKMKAVRHFFTVRSYCVKNFSECKKRKSVNVYGSASLKKTRV